MKPIGEPLVVTKLFSSLNDPQLVEMIIDGAIGVIATDTVYGLIARATDASALERFYQTKPRNNEPGTIIGASTGQFTVLGFAPRDLEKSRRYWPGAVSVVLDATNVSHNLKHHREALPLRMPNTSDLHTLLKSTGALMTTSANAPGEPTAKTISEAKAYFGNAVDFYVDSGPIDNPPSTIIGFDASGEVIIYRAGAVTIS